MAQADDVVRATTLLAPCLFKVDLGDGLPALENLNACFTLARSTHARIRFFFHSCLRLSSKRLVHFSRSRGRRA